MMTKRSLLLPLMTTFDSSDTTQPCSQRNISTVAPQALALLNNEFVHQQSNSLAARVAREAGGDPSAQIVRAWWLALGRAPTQHEIGTASAHLDAQAKHFRAQAGAAKKGLDERDVGRLSLTSLCHVLMNLNEFIYVD